MSYALVGFLDAVNGAARTITLPDGKLLQVTIPEGAEDRQMLRLKGQGMPGFDGGPAGDAYLELHIEPHPFFRRKDDNIHVEVPATLKEAALGARIEVPTISGPVAVTVPKGSNTGTTLRLRDRGIRRRDGAGKDRAGVDHRCNENLTPSLGVTMRVGLATTDLRHIKQYEIVQSTIKG